MHNAPWCISVIITLVSYDTCRQFIQLQCFDRRLSNCWPFCTLAFIKQWAVFWLYSWMQLLSTNPILLFHRRGIRWNSWNWFSIWPGLQGLRTWSIVTQTPAASSSNRVRDTQMCPSCMPSLLTGTNKLFICSAACSNSMRLVFYIINEQKHHYIIFITCFIPNRSVSLCSGAYFWTIAIRWYWYF